MATTTPRCLVRGSINIDEFFSLPHIVKPGETISSTGFTKRAGGKGANQAYSCARAGGAVDIDGCIGPDGEWVREMLAGAGVGVDRLKTVNDEVTGRAIIQSSADGENSIVLHAGANHYLPGTDTAPVVEGYTHMLLQNEIPLPSTLAYLTANPEIISVFNPSPMLSPEELRAFPWSTLSWLIVNEGELETLLEAFGAQSEQSGSDLIEGCTKGIQKLHECAHFNKSVSIICTIGPQGILYFKPGEGGAKSGHLPAGKLIKPVKDTTGAGDCFAGYFTAGLMRQQKGDDLEEVLKMCLSACAICVESAGAMESVPLREDVVARLEA